MNENRMGRICVFALSVSVMIFAIFMANELKTDLFKLMLCCAIAGVNSAIALWEIPYIIFPLADYETEKPDATIK